MTKLNLASSLDARDSLASHEKCFDGDEGRPLRHRLTIRLLAVAGLALILTSCRDGLLDPVGSVAQRNPVRVSGTLAAMHQSQLQSLVPLVMNLRSEVRNGALVIHGELMDRDRRVRPFYDPMRDGGWMMQLFVNTDQRDTGYWLGYDYIVRGGEWSPSQGTMVTRKITFEDQYPGGWGPETGLATFTLHGYTFDIAVPLEDLGGDDGDAAFALETYAIVSCLQCDQGLTQVSMDDYFGVSSRSGDAIALSFGRSSETPLSPRWAPRPGHSTDADFANGASRR